MTLTAGAAEINITPPIGVELAGYGFGPSVGLLSDLKAQALVLRDEHTAVALLTVDLLTVGEAFTAAVRRQVETELDIPGTNVLISASHSHSSPTTSPLRQWGRVDATYAAALEHHLVGAVRLAQSRAVPARVATGCGEVTNISEDRRHTHGPINPEVPLLRFDGPDGEPIAVLFNFGCHPVSLHSYRNLLSSDYPGYAREVIRGVLGEHVVAMFTLGAAGDINPAGYVAGGTHPRRSQQIGSILGCEVARVALDPSPMADLNLAVAQKVIYLPVYPLPPVAELTALRDQTAAEAERLRVEGASWAAISVPEIQRDWADDALRAHAAGRSEQPLACELSALRIGDAAVVMVPLEMFTATGLAIKHGSPAALTLIASNSNGGVGYLPTRDAYNEQDYTNPQGLAPKIYGIYALAPEAEPLVSAAACSLLKELW